MASRSLAVWLSLFALAGALAGWLVGGAVPAALRPGALELHAEPYRIERPDTDPLMVSPAKWLKVPFLFADFDLELQLELAADTDCDLLLRQVEPRLAGAELLPFDGRFAVLRLSTGRDGPALLDRDAALFAPARTGAALAPGLPATVLVEARGRELRANVAGRWLPLHRADDEYGMLTLLCRGGDVAVRRFVLQPKGLPAAWRFARSTWAGAGALAGLLLGLAGLALARRRVDALLGLPLLPLAALLFRGVVDPAPLQLPPAGALAAVLGAAALVGLSPALGRGWRAALAWLPAAALLALGSVAAPPPSAEFARVFGAQTGSQPSEALGQLLRGPFQIHDVAAAARRVLLLGGQLLYQPGSPDDHLEVLLAARLRAAAGGQPVDVPSLPTVDGHSAQQWALYERFYAGYRPQVLVFGVPRDEAVGGRSDAARLQATVAAVRAHCREHGAGLVLFTAAELPADLRAVLDRAAADGVPLVVAADGQAPAAVADQLAAAIAPQLR